MTPAAYAGFFLATAGAAAAFIGLLFVALSIHPRLAFGRPTPDGVPRQLLTEATLVTLGNGFVLSCVGLLPTIYVGWFALGLGPWGVLWAGRLPGLLDRAHRHAAVTWRHRLRVTGVSGVAIAFGAGEFVVGLSLPREARTSWAVSGLAVIILGLYALGMARACILLGDPRQGWSGWLNPLEDLVAPRESEAPSDAYPRARMDSNDAGSQARRR